MSHIQDLLNLISTDKTDKYNNNIIHLLVKNNDNNILNKYLSNNINQLAGLEKPNKHNEPVSNDHKKQTNCNLWTSSSTSLVIDQFILDYKNQFLDGELILYKASFDTSFIHTSQYARAPPTLI